jgi:hypothetical protein
MLQVNKFARDLTGTYHTSVMVTVFWDLSQSKKWLMKHSKYRQIKLLGFKIRRI